MRHAALALIAPLALSMCGARISIVEGESMAPTIRAGDAVVTLSQPFGAPSVGSVLLVESDGRRLLHRLARYEEGSLWMKGDASVSGDSRPVSSSDVLGTLAVVIPTSYLAGNELIPKLTKKYYCLWMFSEVRTILSSCVDDF